MAVSSAKPTPIPIYTMAVSSHKPRPISIYSIPVPSCPVPPSPTPNVTTVVNCNALLPNPAIIRYALGQGPHPLLTTQHGALVQSTMSAQTLNSRPIVSPTPPFNGHFDPAHMDFLKSKVVTFPGRGTPSGNASPTQGPGKG